MPILYGKRSRTRRPCKTICDEICCAFSRRNFSCRNNTKSVTHVVAIFQAKCNVDFRRYYRQGDMKVKTVLRAGKSKVNMHDFVVVELTQISLLQLETQAFQITFTLYLISTCIIMYNTFRFLFNDMTSLRDILCHATSLHIFGTSGDCTQKGPNPWKPGNVFFFLTFIMFMLQIKSFGRGVRGLQEMDYRAKCMLLILNICFVFQMM